MTLEAWHAAPHLPRAHGDVVVKEVQRPRAGSHGRQHHVVKGDPSRCNEQQLAHGHRVPIEGAMRLLGPDLHKGGLCRGVRSATTARVTDSQAQALQPEWTTTAGGPGPA